MDGKYLNDDSESASDKMNYLEEANQAAIKEIHRLQILVEDKADEVSDLSKMNEALLNQVEEKNKVIAEQDVHPQRSELMEYLEEANQSAIKEIDRLQVELAEKNGVLDDVSQLNEVLLGQVEEKNKLLADLENRVHKLETEQEHLLAMQNDSTIEASDSRSEETQHYEKLKTAIAVSEKQISVLRKVALASQSIC